MKLQVNDKAPDFALNNQDGEEITLASLTGKKKVFFFYPKDNTPGCTAEACSLRDHYSTFQSQGYEVFGISPDSEAKHKKFIDKHGFQYDLLADENKEMLNAYGVWGNKKFMGKEYMGVLRTTFVVDENNIITNIIEKVKTKEHGPQLFEAIGI